MSEPGHEPETVTATIAKLTPDMNAAFDKWSADNQSADLRAAFRAGVSWDLQRVRLHWMKLHNYEPWDMADVEKVADEIWLG